MAGKRLLFLLVLIPLYLGTVVCFRGSIYEPTSFQDTGEWDAVYTQTCVGRRHDLFREPRDEIFPDRLQAPRESKTPIVINSSDVTRSPDKVTLHVYNYPGIRGGYSVAYGFQRNKECIHGQDRDCVVDRSFGKMRALVVNAERFKKGQDLNYIKDHFLVEDPEKFVTILGGGSIYERKFYEAVFLGGFLPKALQNRGQSSHQIDGKTYPMEIYMYFVDEAVPAMALTTILVVLVEESERDNPFVKPIVTAVRNKLYDEERRFLKNNEFIVRQEKVFQNQVSSLNYDLNQIEKDGMEGKYRRLYKVKQEGSGASIDIEDTLTAQMEKYEKMEALNSRLLLHDEDNKVVKERHTQSSDDKKHFFLREPDGELFDRRFDELHMLIFLPVFITGGRQEIASCAQLTMTQHYGEYEALRTYFFTKNIERYLGGRTSVPFMHSDPDLMEDTQYKDALKKHKEEFEFMYLQICRHLLSFGLWKRDNYVYGQKRIILPVKEKYEFIAKYEEIRKNREKLNELVYQHFFGNDSLHQAGLADGKFAPWFKTEELKHNFVEYGEKLLIAFQRADRYEAASVVSTQLFHEIAKEVGFSSEQNMRDVLYYHKTGSKSIDLKMRRHFYHNGFYGRYLPHQMKRRGYVELGGMETSESEIEAEQERNPLKVKVEQAFQISWLIPPTGGYYYYSGSSPVPPCFRAQNVIVFKRPIKMSKYQIDILTRVPTSFDRDDDILHTTPVIDETKFRVTLKADKTKGVRYQDVEVPVYDQPRNHLFLGHDGVHKNSVEEYERRLLKRQMLQKEHEATSDSTSLTTMWPTETLIIKIKILCFLPIILVF